MKRYAGGWLGNNGVAVLRVARHRVKEKNEWKAPGATESSAKLSCCNVAIYLH